MEEKELMLDDSMFEPLDSSEKNNEFIAVESKTYLQDAWRRFKKNKLALFGLIFLILITLAAIIIPMVSPFTYDGQDLANRNALPNMVHLMGTDKLGRDIMVRVMYGARISLTIGFVAAFLNLIIGVIYGGISGFVGGKVDMVMMRIVDCIYAIPSMLYVILIMVLLGAGIQSIIIAIGTTYWVDMARVVRGQVLSLKNQEFVMAAKTIGSSTKTILLEHLIPNSMGSILVTVTMLIPSAIFMEAFLSYLGIGLQPPLASLGTMCNDATQNLRTCPYQLFIPALVICLIMFGFNFIGDGLRDALDPKLKK